VKKSWVAVPVAIAAPLVLAICVDAMSTPAPPIALSRAAATTSQFAPPTRVAMSSVTPTWATVRFVLPATDWAAASEQVVVYPAPDGRPAPAFRATATESPVTVTGLKPGTPYYAEVSVNPANGLAASGWQVSSTFTTPTGPATPAPIASPVTSGLSPTGTAPAPDPASTSPAPAATWMTTAPVAGPAPATPAPAPATPAPDPAPATPASFPTTSAPLADLPPTFPDQASSTSAPASGPASSSPASAPTDTATTPVSAPTTSAPGSAPAAGVPFAPALAAYSTVAQSYSASDMVSGGWAQDANDTAEGGGSCPVANTTYSSALDAVVMTTNGLPTTSAGADCAHIRSQFTVPTSGDVVEAKIWLPGSATGSTLLDWASMWTDGANGTNGTENWPADTEVDAVETQYGASYVSTHYGSVSAGGGSTGDWTTEPQGWEPAGASYATAVPSVPDVQPGWNVVDIEFTSTVANIYYNGALYVTIPASILSHLPAYLDFGISGPSGSDPNSSQWPAGAATEDVQYVKVFS
jgi:hypothetical protein